MNIQEILNNIEHTHYTTSEIKEKFDISPATLRAYISRDKVIPEDKRIKIGRQWYIEKEFAENLWGLKMKNTTVYKIYEDYQNYKLKGFEYKEGMVLDFENVAYPVELGLFEDLEEAREELKKHKTKVELWGDPQTVTVTEYYIEEQEGYFEDGEFEFVDGGDIWVAELEDPEFVKEVEEKGRE